MRTNLNCEWESGEFDVAGGTVTVHLAIIRVALQRLGILSLGAREITCSIC